MKTVWKNIIGACALVGVTTLVTTQVVSQDKEPGKVEQEQMMEEWIRVSQPGAEHAQMLKQAGKWKQTSKHWEYPGAEATVSKGMATYEPILNNRYMVQRMKTSMEFQGQMQDFEGFGLHGYDTIKKKHFFVWADDMSTMIMVGEGEETAPGVITYMSEMQGPMGEAWTMKSVSMVINDDENIFEMYMKQPDGSWHRTMEMTSVRK